MENIEDKNSVDNSYKVCNEKINRINNESNIPKNIQKICDSIKTIICPLSGKIFKNPVILKQTNVIYEKEDIEKYIKKEKKCFVTNSKITDETLISNMTTQNLVKNTFFEIISNLTNEEFEEIVCSKIDKKSEFDDNKSINSSINFIKKEVFEENSILNEDDINYIYNLIVEKFRINKEDNKGLIENENLIDLSSNIKLRNPEINDFMKGSTETLKFLMSENVLSSINNIQNNDIHHLILKGLTYENKKMKLEALECYNNAILKDPQNPEVYVRKGNILFELNNKENSIIEFDKAINLNPLCSDAYCKKGKSLYFLNKFSECLECFNKCLEIDPYNIDALRRKADTLDDLNRREEAIELYDQVIKLDPFHPQVYNSKGFCLNLLNRKEEAIESYLKSIELNNNEFSFNNLGLVYYNLGRIDESVKNYKKAIEIYPNNSKLISNLAYVSRNILPKEKLIEMYERAIQLNPSIFFNYHRICNVLEDLGRYEEALEYYKTSINFNKDDYMSLHYIGMIYIKLKQYNLALEYLNKALKIKEDHNESIKLISEVNEILKLNKELEDININLIKD